MNRTLDNDTGVNRSQTSVDLRTRIRIATWNVLTLNQDGLTELLSRELSKYHVSIAGLQEVRWLNQGEAIKCGVHYLWSGRDDGIHSQGVAIAMSPKVRRSLVAWSPVSSRIITARFLHRRGHVSVVCCYAPTEMAEDSEKDVFYQDLTRVLSRISRHDIVIGLGDFNATVGTNRESWRNCLGPVSSGRCDDNGHRLLQVCSSHGLCIGSSWFRRRNIHQYTWYSNDGVTKKTIDHILISRRWLSCLQYCRVFRGAEIGNSDHRMLVAGLKLKLKANGSHYKPPRYEIAKLSDPLIASNYAAEVSNRFSLLSPEEYSDPSALVTEAVWDTFKTATHLCADQVLGRSRPPRKPWISNSTLEIIEDRRAARLRGDFARYRALNKPRKKALVRDLERYWTSKAKTIEEAAKRADQRTVYRELRSCGISISDISAKVKDSSGNMLTAEADCVSRWQEYFDDLLNKPPVNLDPSLTETNDEDSQDDRLSQLITPLEVATALKRMKLGKAPGICGINGELLRSGEQDMVLWLTHLFNVAWMKEEIPEDWRRGVILPIWKRKGDKQTCGNYRGITLLSTPGKVFMQILLKRAQTCLRSRRRIEQAGFMPNRSTIDQIFALRQLIEKVREFRESLHIAFVDFKCAFDSIDRQAIWSIMKNCGVDSKVIRLIKNFYVGSTSCVRLAGKHSDWFSVNSGVRQGCVAAPELFNSVMDHLMGSFQDRAGTGFWLGPRLLSDLDYADDVAIFAHSRDELISALSSLQTEAIKLGLSISWSKTKLMLVSPDNHVPSSLSLFDESIDYVDKFTYLGSVICNDGSIQADINARISKTACAMHRLSGPLWKKRRLSRRTKMAMYNALAISVLLYGSETWPTKQTDEIHLDSVDMRNLRRLEGVKWFHFTRNETIRSRTNQPPASHLLKQRRLRWFGHVKRMSVGYPARLLLDFDPRLVGWRRPRGRPRLRWLDAVRSDLQAVGVAPFMADRLAQDRGRWRALVKAVPATLASRRQAP